MSGSDFTLLVAAAGLLALAALCFARGGGSGLKKPLGVLTLDLGGLHLATLAFHLTRAPAWERVDGVLTSLAPPLMFHVVLSFTGDRRSTRFALRAAYVLFGLLAILCLPSSRDLTPWLGGEAWARVFFVSWCPVLAYAVVILVRHLASTTDVREKGRTRLMLAAIALGGALASVDALASTGLSLPRVAPLGTLVGSLLLATAIFRLRLFDRDLSASALLYSIAMILASVTAFVVLVRVFDRNVAPIVLGASALTVVVTLVVRELAASQAVVRARTDRLAALGRFAAQMAHDVKNPLAAVVGASQVLEGTALTDEQKKFVSLILDQTKRIREITERYERLGRVDVTHVALDLREIGERVIAAQKVSAKSISFHLDIAADASSLSGDADLIEGALENLVRNGIEAMPNGGEIHVRTESDADPDALKITVRDTGQGMDPRTVERALEEFYTTKTSGSGLGLPFVRRVAIAHGGAAAITSRLGEGTSVEMRVLRQKGIPKST